MFSRDVCGCLRKRVSANVGWCSVLWLLSFLCVWYVFDNVSCTYSDVLYMSLHIPGSMHQPLSLQNNTTHEITQQISRKLLRMDVLTSETCRALNNEIIKQVTSSWSLFIQELIYVRLKPIALTTAIEICFN